jgi:Tol biopolymer transport system component/serine/threonine protein kinase
MALTTGTRLGPYEILSPLGVGGMGEVYRARDPRLGREVAVKILPQDFAASEERLRRFEREISVTGGLNHPNIVAVYDVGQAEGLPYVVYELLEGKTLRSCLQGMTHPTVRKSVDLALQLARGLAAAHEKGVIHRDLKPENLFVTSDGRLKILDFGLAKLANQKDEEGEPAGGPDPEPARSEQPTHAWQTSAGLRLGTLAYMSPEQVRAGPVDHRADIFAFGAILYEMLAGRPAFLRATRLETQAAILSEDPPGFSEHGPAPPPALQAFLSRCLEKAPEERFQSARDLSFALEAMLSESTSGSTPREGGATGRRRRLWAAGGVAALAAVAALVFSWRGHRAGPGEFPDWTPRQLTSDPGWEAEPALSFDGSLVAYSSNRGGSADIWVIDAHGGTSIRLTDDPGADRSPAWLPDGTAVVFVSDRTGRPSIWEVPRLGGAAVLLVPDAEDPAVSADGTRIAFSTFGSLSQHRVAVAELADPTRLEVLTGNDDGLFGHRHPSWSPDGETLAYADQRNLWLVPARGGRATQLTTEYAKDDRPVWSADGRHLYCSSLRTGTLALWQVAVPEGTAVRMTLGTGPEGEPSLSKDGTRLAYSTYLDDPDIVLMDLRTRERHELPGLREDTTPAFAPDGSAVVFSSDRAGSVDLWRQPLSGARPRGNPIRVTTDTGAEVVPVYSPDGRWIAYGHVEGEDRNIDVVPAGGGRTIPFADDPSPEMHPAWSPDGSQLAFVADRGGGYRVWVRGFRGGAPVGEARPLTSTKGGALLPAWSPDGSVIAFVRVVDGVSDVWTVDAGGRSAEKQVTHGADADFIRCDATTRSFLVSGTWGARTLRIRRLAPATGETVPFEPGVVLGEVGDGGDFDLSRDGSVLAFTRYEARGDIWLLEVGRGSF